MVISLENVNEDLISELKRFYLCYYSPDNRFFSDGYLSWMLLNNPHGVGISVNVRLEGDIISNMFLIPVELIKYGNVKLAYYVVDVLSHPNHRDKNLFIKMIRSAVKMAKDNERCLIGHPNSNALPGWKRAKMSFQPNFNSYISRPGVNRHKKNVYSRSQISEKDREDISLLIKKNNKLTINSSVEFIAWKYIDCPSKKYKIEFFYNKSSLIGVIVSYKVKGLIDRVVHFMYDDQYIREIICSTIIPKIFSFADTCQLASIDKLFFNIL